ncbi:purine-nucleoside phosphorylase [bacterium]|nr:purine-nucleoside phosphorylase [bacterium]
MLDQGQSLRRKVDEAAAFLNNKIGYKIPIGIILGTGLGKLAEDVELEQEILYHDIPHFPVSTVESHEGKLLIGKIEGKPVVVMQGRFHFYEGYTMQEVTFPVRVMKEIGVEYLLVSNVAGGLNPLYREGDLMIMDDHINLLGDNPLRGVNEPSFGPRFPDMSEPYNKGLIAIAEKAALENHIPFKRGVYAAMTGPTLETRAEYRFLRNIGADVIGMSTIPECIVANQSGMKVFGATIVSDLCFPDNLKPATLEAIIKVANGAQPNLTALMKGVIRNIDFRF